MTSITYTVTVSKPGYLPELEPYTVETLADVVHALTDELELTCDRHDVDHEHDRRDDDDVAWCHDECELEAAHLRAMLVDTPWLLERGVSVELHGYVHEATPVGWRAGQPMPEHVAEQRMAAQLDAERRIAEREQRSRAWLAAASARERAVDEVTS